MAAVFDQVARVYDTRVLQRLVYQPNQDVVVAELRALGARRVLDVGCGTGILATRIQDELHPEAVFGCDLSAGMLEQARARSGAVTWLEGRAEQLPLPDGSVDAVVSTEAFHFFDHPAALAEFRRVLAPGGHVIVAVLNPRTRALSRLLNAQPAIGAAASWPTQREMREQFETAGLTVLRQARVHRILSTVVPGVATVAVRR